MKSIVSGSINRQDLLRSDVNRSVVCNSVKPIRKARKGHKHLQRNLRWLPKETKKMETIEERIIEEDPAFAVVKPRKTRERSKSLFEAERPKLTETDHGVFVMTHADFPQRIRTHSVPIDPEQLKSKSSAFNSTAVRKIIHDVLENKLYGKSYSSKECNSAVKDIANIIKDKMSELEMPHYKFACTCLITRRIKPAPVVESGCVWDNAKTSVDEDNFAEFLYKNEDLYALGTVYGIYDGKFEKKSAATTSMSTKSCGRPSPIPE